MENRNDELLEICHKYWQEEEITIEEIETIAYADIYDYCDVLSDFIIGTFHAIMREKGKPWTECEDYSSNTYHTGYELDGRIFITHYTGVAGHYWDNDEEYTICKW